MNNSSEKRFVKNNNIIFTEQDKEIVNFLKMIARRKTLQRWIGSVIWCGLASAFAAFILNVTAIFVPVYHAALYGWLMILAGGMISVLYSIIRRSSVYEAAKYADAAGLKERLITSIEYQGLEEGFARLLKEDTLHEIKRFDKKLRLPLVYPWKTFMAASLFFCMFVVAIFVPSQAKKDALDMHKLAVQAKEEKNKAEKAMELLDKASENEKDKADVAKLKTILEEAKQELAESESRKDIKKAKERLESKLKQELAESDSKKLMKAVQPLVSGTDLVEMADFNKKLAEIADSGGISSELADELKGVAESLKAEQLGQLLDNLKKAMGDGEVSVSEAASALSDISNRDAQMAAATITAFSGNGGAGNVNNGQNGSGSGNGNGSGNGSGSGGGNSSGNGRGSGWNMGNSEGLERTGQEGKGEVIYLTDKQQGKDENLTGKRSGEARITEKSSQQGSAFAGSKVDLDMVIGDYSSAAYAKVNSNKVPSAMKDVVKEYFSGLGDW